MVARAKGSYRGAAGRAKADEELARQKAKAEARKEQGNQPFRFKVAVGETTQFVIVDDEPEFYRFEHNLQDKATQRWNIFTGCTHEWENCPVCESTGKEPYYGLYLTVIDFTPFETRDKVTVEFSRKLLVVKPGQQKKFHRAYAKAQKEGRTLRGAVFEVSRDGPKDSGIGNDIEFLEFMEEDELTSYVRSWKDREGKKHTEKCYETFDYDTLFPEPDSDSLRALVGGAPAPGSRQQEEKEIGRRASGRRAAPADEEDDDYAPASKKDRMSSSRRGRAAPEDEEEEDDPPPRRPSRKARDEEEDEAPPPRRGRGKPAAEDEEEDAPAPKRRGRAAPEEEEDDDPPPRRGRARQEPEEEEERPVSRGTGKRPTSRSRQEPDDDEEEEAPARRTPGVGRRGSR